MERAAHRCSYANSHVCWCILGNRDQRDYKGPEGKENIKKKELEILGMEREGGGNGGAVNMSQKCVFVICPSPHC